MPTYSSRHNGPTTVIPVGHIKFTLHTTECTCDREILVDRPTQLGALIVAIKQYLNIPGEVTDLVVTTL